MLNFLLSHAGPLLIALVVLLSFIKIVRRAFRWSRRRAAQIEHAQRCAGAVTWPSSAGIPHSPTLGTVVTHPLPVRSARSEMRSAPR